ncbi:hypothetical protein HK104_001601 [Borealophlyctis nickersoniae]|nr:hypothetical protein HK104_001601 [Borealophlyctis nickersoniae]
MAGGNPFEPYNVFGIQIPKYKLVGYMLLIYATGITAVVQYKKRQPPAPITFDSPEEESWVKKYVQYRKEEKKKPVLVQEPFRVPTGLYSI